MEINEMTRKDFDALPYRKSWDSAVWCDSIVILPLKKKHDSGYWLLDFVACNDGEPLCRLSGCSDVVHIGGIGKRGVEANWSIDCLPKSGLLHLFCNKKIAIGSALSSLEIWVEKGVAMRKDIKDILAIVSNLHDEIVCAKSHALEPKEDSTLQPRTRRGDVEVENAFSDLLVAVEYLDQMVDDVQDALDDRAQMPGPE